MKKILVSIPVYVAIFFMNLYAQSTFQGGLGLYTGIPKSEFKENVDDIGFGGGGHFGYQIPDTPFIVGAGLYFLVYGSESRDEPFSETIPDVTVTVTTTNNFMLGNLYLRVQPLKGIANGFLKPYLEGFWGFHYLFTDTKIEDLDEWDEYDDDVASEKNMEDFTSSYGGGGGLMIRVWAMDDSDNPPVSVNVDLGIRYAYGGKAKYLREGDIIREKGKISYNPSESATNLMTIGLGVTVNFTITPWKTE